MSAPILGRAWPCLLAPGLLVWRDGLDPEVGDALPLRQYVVGVVGADAFGRRDLQGVWLHSLDVFEDPGLGLVSANSVQIDYADQHTRDRVLRALWSCFGRADALHAPTLWFSSETNEWVLWRGHEQDSVTLRHDVRGAPDVVVPALCGLRDPVLALRAIADVVLPGGVRCSR